MLSVARSSTVIGLEALPVTVEVDIAVGLPAFTIVGLPDAAVKEARERVRAGIVNSEYDFPLRRITVNLAPGDLKKEGPSFDLPIALATLSAAQLVNNERFTNYMIAGELSLTGEVKPVSGALSMAAKARQIGMKGVVVPEANVREAALIAGLEVVPVANLREAADFFNGAYEPRAVACEAPVFGGQSIDYGVDFAEVKGQEHVKRALEIAAAGHHNILMTGPPGSGKTMLARRLPTIMPALTFEESVEITRVYSVAGLLSSDKPLITTRPFRAPHHTISSAGLVGGGSTPRPGEISLSHHGILFLDEFPEFSKQVLEVLRQPLEDRVVTISRAAASLTYPADFLLVGGMNPCNCGFLTDTSRPCTCTPIAIQRYRSRISGPLLDRIDIQLEVARLGRGELMGEAKGESSEVVRTRVEAAREVQRQRFEGSYTKTNSSMTPKEVKRFCRLDALATSLLEKAVDRLALSGRSYERILKVARTIADLAGGSPIQVEHIAEAIQYRALDRGEIV